MKFSEELLLYMALINFFNIYIIYDNNFQQYVSTHTHTRAQIYIYKQTHTHEFLVEIESSSLKYHSSFLSASTKASYT